MFFRLLLVLLLVFWIVPLVRRFMTRGRRPASEVSAADDRLADLTRQDISDADYEELPPEK